jgi:hypothetical protein
MRLTGAIKNRAAMGDPVMQAILTNDRVIGQLVGVLLHRISLLDLGGAKAGLIAEGAAQAAATAVTPVNVAPVPARHEFARDLKDSERSRLAGLGQGALSPAIVDSFVGEGLQIWMNTLINDVLDLALAASYTIGVTNTALSWAGMHFGYLAGINRGGWGPEGAMAGIRLKGVTDLASDALSLTGAVQMASQVQQFLEVGQTGYIGTFFGGCRIYMLDDVPTSGVDDVGMMWGSRGVATKHEIHPLPADSAMILQSSANNGWITTEAKRGTTTSAVTRIEHAFWFGVAEEDSVALAKILYKTA